MAVVTTPFFGLVVRWYSWISEQVMVKENNTQSFSSVVSNWTKITKERHSRACLAQRRRILVWAWPHKNFAGITLRGLAGALENREI